MYDTKQMKQRLNSAPKEGDLRIWHVPNPPHAGFEMDVRSPRHAYDVLSVLWAYDNYLGDELIFTNASGLQVFEDGEWVEWHNDEDQDFDEWSRDYEEAMAESRVMESY